MMKTMIVTVGYYRPYYDFLVPTALDFFFFRSAAKLESFVHYCTVREHAKVEHNGATTMRICRLVRKIILVSN